MTSELLTAIASLGTFIVITATAIAALVQVRHMRSSNQIIALTEFRETFESEFFRENSEQVLKTLPMILENPSIRNQIAARTPIPTIRELLPARAVANLFTTLGVFVQRGIIERDLACELWNVLVLLHWDAVAPLVSNLRVAYGNPSIWEGFEYMASISRTYRRQHPCGMYPKGTPREEMPDVWAEVQQSAQQQQSVTDDL